MKRCLVAALRSECPACILADQELLVGLILGAAGGADFDSGFATVLGWPRSNLHAVAALAPRLLAVRDQAFLLAHESGLITVDGAWAFVDQSKNILKSRHIIEFKENLRTLLIGCLFMRAGVNVLNLADIGEIGLHGFGGWWQRWWIFVRPISVYLCLPGKPLNYREANVLAVWAPGVGSWLRREQCVRNWRWRTRRLVISARRPTGNGQRFLVIIGTVRVYGMAAGPLAAVLEPADDSPTAFLIAGADFVGS